MSQKKEFLEGKTPVTFLDLFAGAGGISEGFLQSYTDTKYFDFILASDINDNCELTHRVRYNYQLGLETDFLTKDIMSKDFLSELLKKVGDRSIDVVTGGPSCQSFSLSGRRRKFDKRDNLFEHYLKVIEALRPKYFVMENVKGILTKDRGRFVQEIMRRIRSIVDKDEVGCLYLYAKDVLSRQTNIFLRSCFVSKLKMEVEDDIVSEEIEDQYFQLIDDCFKRITRQIPYKISKSNVDINTVRHGLSFLRRSSHRKEIQNLLIHEKTVSNIDNDLFVQSLNDFIEIIGDDSVVEKIEGALDRIAIYIQDKDELQDLKTAIGLYVKSLDECLEFFEGFVKKDGSSSEYERVLDKVRLYRISAPIVVKASDFGVPQNRERVLFIGCRKDQTLIDNIVPTITKEERVTVYEALSDLDFIGNGEIKTDYGRRPKNKKLDYLLRRRTIEGNISETSGLLYSDWSRSGRLKHRFNFDVDPFYVRSLEELGNESSWIKIKLFNHQTSDQKPEVRKRLSVIAKYGEYDDACKEELNKLGLDSDKRNYTVLVPDSQSPTVVTMPDDFIHYSAHRSMTVREMARLQSFDDSFVFQGKRQTGGEKRKSEIPQYTLVGNAVPPLLAREIGNTILKTIK